MAEIVDFGLQQHKIKMDSRYFENVLSVVAGDTGRRLEVQLLDTNGTVQDTTGLKLRLNAVIAGKPTFTDATLVDATTGKYRLDLSNGMFLAPGNWQFQWQIIDATGKKLHSFAFTGNVGSNISEGGSQATNFYLNLEDLKAMQEDLVNGTFNSEVLETNIAEKLTNLETQYAPKLTEVTAQLAQTPTKNETGWATLNTFDEPTRAVIQGNEPGTINAVLGERNVKNSNIDIDAVNIDNIDFYKSTKNLFNPTKLLINKKINGADGAIVNATSNESDVITGIPVAGGLNYVKNARGSFVFRDETNAALQVYNNILYGITVKAPDLAVTMDVSLVKVNQGFVGDDKYPGVNRIQIEVGKKMTPFVPYGESIFEKPMPIQEETYNVSILPMTADGRKVFNAVPFTQDNLTTFNGNQYAVWWNSKQNPIIAKRKLPDGEWNTFDLSMVEGNPLNAPLAPDGHNNIVVGISKDGLIHVAANHHQDPIRYVRSDRPEDITSFSKGNMGAISEVTYPQFFNTKDGELLFSYRAGSTSSGNTILRRYHRQTNTWTVVKSPLVDGIESSHHGYLTHIAVDQYGVIHIAGTWRDTPSADSNQNIFYLKSKDLGATWLKSDDTPQIIPVTFGNCERILETEPTGSGIVNQFGLEVDFSGFPHIAYFKYDESGNTQIYHLYQSATGWVDEKVTDFDRRLDTDAEGWSALMSRPSIFCYENRVFIIYRVNYSSKKGTLRLIEVTPNKPIKDVSILNMDLDYFEPTFDTQRLYNRKELSILALKNHTNAYGSEIGEASYVESLPFVYTINLSQIDDIMNKKIDIPELVTVRSSTFSVNHVLYGQGIYKFQFPILQDGKQYFARTSFAGTITGGGMLTRVMSIGDWKKGQYKTQSGENIANTHSWIYIDREGLLTLETTLSGHTTGTVDGAILLELAELKYK